METIEVLIPGKPSTSDSIGLRFLDPDHKDYGTATPVWIKTTVSSVNQDGTVVAMVGDPRNNGREMTLIEGESLWNYRRLVEVTHRNMRALRTQLTDIRENSDDARLQVMARVFLLMLAKSRKDAITELLTIVRNQNHTSQVFPRWLAFLMLFIVVVTVADDV